MSDYADNVKTWHEPISQDPHTQAQAAAVMLAHGTPEQQVEALRSLACRRIAMAEPVNSVDAGQREGMLRTPEHWREVCRTYRCRMNEYDISQMAKLRTYIEEGLLIVVRPDGVPPTAPDWVEQACRLAAEASIQRTMTGAQQGIHTLRLFLQGVAAAGVPVGGEDKWAMLARTGHLSQEVADAARETASAIGGVPVASLAPDTAYMKRLIDVLQENGDPVSVDAADEFQRLLDAAGVQVTDASQLKQPGWNHVMQAFVDGAREARANPDATDAEFGRAADGYTKRVFAEVDPAGDRYLNGTAAVGVREDRNGL